MSAPVCIWLTGLPASGKTTLARALVDLLKAAGRPVLWLDGDDLRPHLVGAGHFDDPSRERFYGALTHLVALGLDGGADVVVSATAQRRAWRDRARGVAGPGHFVEVHVATPLATCVARDPKGLYRGSASGEVQALPGAGAPYEAPLAPEVAVDLGAISVHAGLGQVQTYLALHRPSS